ncbi:hypothetical protein GCM10009677_53590 [Sphaerisporangium rubeum]
MPVSPHFWEGSVVPGSSSLAVPLTGSADATRSRPLGGERPGQDGVRPGYGVVGVTGIGKADSAA